MNYEEKYKEAQKWIESVYPELSYEQQMEAEAFFPELQKSEDEKTREWLIDELHLLYHQAAGDREREKDLTKAISWLEEQRYWKPSEEQLEALKYAYNSCPDTEIGNILRALIDELYKLQEKQCKQEPYEKCKDSCDMGRVQEPKFEKGQWIVQENIGTYKIVEVCESWYEVINSRGDHYSIGFDKESMCHLWRAIKDAKDGEVLVCGDNNDPFIFKGFLDPFHPKCPVAYCGVFDDSFQISSGDGWWTDEEENISPAEKPYCDFLFKKMHEAGYEWNAEKKKVETSLEKSAIEYGYKVLSNLCQGCKHIIDAYKAGAKWQK